MAMHVLLVQATMLLGVILSYTHGATAAITTAAATLSPRQYNILQEMVNCDGGHGVFTCAHQGECHFDRSGAFDCCMPQMQDSDPCPPTTKCVNYADRDTQGPSCKLDKGCQLCSEKENPHCFFVTNPVAHVHAVMCNTASGRSTTSFAMEGRQFAWPTSSASTTSSVTAETRVTGTASNSVSATVNDPNAPTQSGIHDMYPQSKTLKGHVIAAVAVAILSGTALIAIAIFLIYRWRKTRQGQWYLANDEILSGQNDGAPEPTINLVQNKRSSSHAYSAALSPHKHTGGGTRPTEHELEDIQSVRAALKRKQDNKRYERANNYRSTVPLVPTTPPKAHVPTTPKGNTTPIEHKDGNANPSFTPTSTPTHKHENANPSSTPTSTPTSTLKPSIMVNRRKTTLF